MVSRTKYSTGPRRYEVQAEGPAYTSELGNLLLDGRRQRQPIDLLSERTALSVDAAYGVQHYVMAKICEERGESVSAYKIAMTSRTAMSRAGAVEPASGGLTTSDVLSNHARISLGEMYQPRVEPELVFILTDDLSPNPTASEIRHKSRVVPGLEIPDSRYRDWFGRATLTDLICDGAHAAKAIANTDLAAAGELSLERLQMTLYLGAKPIAEGTSDTVLDNPINALAWLVQHLTLRHLPLAKGLMVWSGSFIPAVRAEEGTYTAEFEGIGAVSVTFES